MIPSPAPQKGIAQRFTRSHTANGSGGNDTKGHFDLPPIYPDVRVSPHDLQVGWGTADASNMSMSPPQGFLTEQNGGLTSNESNAFTEGPKVEVDEDGYLIPSPAPQKRIAQCFTKSHEVLKKWMRDHLLISSTTKELKLRTNGRDEFPQGARQGSVSVGVATKYVHSDTQPGAKNLLTHLGLAQKGIRPTGIQSRSPLPQRKVVLEKNSGSKTHGKWKNLRSSIHQSLGGTKRSKNDLGSTVTSPENNRAQEKVEKDKKPCTSASTLPEKKINEDNVDQAAKGTVVNHKLGEDKRYPTSLLPEIPTKMTLNNKPGLPGLRSNSRPLEMTESVEALSENNWSFLASAGSASGAETLMQDPRAKLLDAIGHKQLRKEHSVQEQVSVNFVCSL
ncbi:hypothetical protein cyc_06208 [Cyclospora cayetanensis]|uniref:Uncharacterized protein n=1 Tax=Cyclospora cayetanensis TaxID=88456 RepID=A0A1D3D9U1_9EIME|nr:hypothetical protein cyc_06208 [Cyclospora cayetanensis]